MIRAVSVRPRPYGPARTDESSRLEAMISPRDCRATNRVHLSYANLVPGHQSLVSRVSSLDQSSSTSHSIVEPGARPSGGLVSRDGQRPGTSASKPLDPGSVSILLSHQRWEELQRSRQGGGEI